MKSLYNEFNENITYQRKVAKGDWVSWKHRWDLKAILIAYNDEYLRNIFHLSDVIITKENLWSLKDEICKSLYVSEQTLKEINDFINQ